MRAYSARSSAINPLGLRNLFLMFMACAWAAVMLHFSDQAGNRLVRLDASGLSFARADRVVAVSSRERPESAELDAIEARVAEVVHRQYLIASEAAREFTHLAWMSGRRAGIDPLLLIAVMAVESRFNPIAESPMGAKGLMQVIPQYHEDKLAKLASGNVLDPTVNVELGARILRDYLDRSGSVEAALQWYNGAPGDESRGYATRVMTERNRFAREPIVATLRPPRI